MTSEFQRGPVEGGQFPPDECWCGDQFLIGVLVRVNNGKPSLEWNVITSQEYGFQDADGDSWGAWSTDDISYWVKLPDRIVGSASCRTLGKRE